jgi:two-component system, NtrC family, sensor histidine kinase HydH
VLFLAVLFAIIATLRYTKTAVLNDQKKQLADITRNLAREYEDRADRARSNNELPPLNNPDAQSAAEILALLSRVVLQNAEGVSGGFYSPKEEMIFGSFYPGDEVLLQRDNTSAERQAILDAARSATSAHRTSEKTLSTAKGIVLINAMPVRDGYTVVGSAWGVKRLPDLPGANRFKAYLITASLGTAALASVLLTLLVIRNLQLGVGKIESGLSRLEGNLTSQIDTQDEPKEIQSIVLAINRLGAALRGKIENEKQIESQLRQAERLASLGRLVAGVAHEVRNPLATIRLRVQMCWREAENSRIRESCAVALEEIERLNNMVNRLLSFARPVQLQLESADLRNLVQERLDFFRDLAQGSQVHLVAKLPSDGLTVSVDKGRMAQVFDNVIQNAIEAMSERGGTLSVSLASHQYRMDKDGGVCVEFRDTGKGMNKAEASHVFDPFFTTKPTGTGLGLSICHELVRAHGGDIRVESEEGRGTKVKITIPASQSRYGGGMSDS